MQNNYNGLFNRTDALILFVLGAFTFCIAFGLSSPALLVNDEWITVNQLNQLAIGSQLIENEGKYGRTFEGLESEYFIIRGNYLAYTLSLPFVSLPAMYGIMIAGDLFRLILLEIWFFLGLCALIACIWLCESTYGKWGVYTIWLIIILFTGLFLVNIYYYQPFSSSFVDSPIESAAVIFTNEILLGLMTPMIYTVFRNLSLPRKTALVGAISVICCSSYLIWSSSAKDHLFVAFLLTTIFWIFSSNLHKNSAIKKFFLFFFTGILCWARTEYGFIILAGLVIWMLISDFAIQKDTRRNFLQSIKNQFFLGVVGLTIGLFPFFINNFIITGNLFIPPQYLYITSSREMLSPYLETQDLISANIISKVFIYIQQIINFYSPNIGDIWIDLSGILLAPENNGVGILFICPIILPALLYAIIHYSTINNVFSQNIRKMLIFSGFIATLTFLGYLRVLHGSTISNGSLPDMRYFSPIYLPLGIISILLLSPLINRNTTRWLGYLVFTVFICAPLLGIATVIFFSYAISMNSFANFFIRVLLLVLILIFGAASLTNRIWDSRRLFPILFSLLVMLPITFQFIYVLLAAPTKINGYLFWQPILEYLFTYVITVMR